MQKPRVTIFHYLTQNVKMIKRFISSKPNDMPQATQADAAHREIYGNSLINTGLFFQTQIAGLHKPICKDHEMHLCQLLGHL